MNILKEVLSLPTAPFHESEVAGYIRTFCKGLGLAPKEDRYGNIIVRYKKGKAA